jgi:hypothetical protein
MVRPYPPPLSTKLKTEITGEKSKGLLSVNNQKNLMENDKKVKNIDTKKNCSNRRKFAVKTQDDERERNDTKLPDPESVSVECDNRTDDGVEFQPANIQDDHCE